MELQLLKALTNRSILTTAPILKLIAAYLLRLNLKNEDIKKEWIKHNFPNLSHKVITILKMEDKLGELTVDGIYSKLSDAIKEIKVVKKKTITIFAFLYVKSLNTKKALRNIIPINRLSNTLNVIPINTISHIEFSYLENKSLYPGVSSDVFSDAFKLAVEEGKSILKDKGVGYFLDLKGI